MKRLPTAYLLFFALVMPIWLIYMITQNGFSFYNDHWAAPVTMFFGSFVAGATSEGGGSGSVSSIHVAAQTTATRSP